MEDNLAKDKDAWIFGLSVYVITVAFNSPLLWSQGSLFPLFTIFILFAIPAGIGYFIGQLKHKKSAKYKHLVLSAGFAYIITDNLFRVFGQDGQAWYMSVVLMLIISALMGWRLPEMFKQNGS